MLGVDGEDDLIISIGKQVSTSKCSSPFPDVKTCPALAPPHLSCILPGEGRVHDCLRSKRQQLSDNCRKEELLLEEQEAENIELRPGIMKVRGIKCGV